MAKAAIAPKPELPPVPDDHAEVILAVIADPSLALRHVVWFDAYYAALSADVAGHTPDVSTERGRDQLKALAFRIVKARTGIEDQRKKLTENWRKLTESVNKTGKVMREKLEALEETARRPLTAWQAKEDARKADIDNAIEGLRNACVVGFDETAESVADRLAKVRGINDLSAERFGERHDEAMNWFDQAVSALTTAHARLVKVEAEAAELTALREQQAQIDREAAAAQMAMARAEQDRLVAERAAQHERERVQQEAEERIAAAQRKAEAEAQRKIDEADRALAEERRQREAERQTLEAAEIARRAREQDEEHRITINGEIRDALVGLGLDNNMARQVVIGLVKGEIPHVKVEY